MISLFLYYKVLYITLCYTWDVIIFFAKLPPKKWVDCIFVGRDSGDRIHTFSLQILKIFIYFFLSQLMLRDCTILKTLNKFVILIKIAGKWFLVTNSIYLRKIITNIVLKALWEISEYFFVDSLFFELILENLLREADFCQLEISKIVKPTIITEIYNFNNQNAHCINIETFPSLCFQRWILKWSLF